MDDTVRFGAIFGICILVLVIAVLKRRAQMLLNFLVRMVVGMVCIIVINDFFADQEIAIAVGLNPVSLLAAGVLGFPGVALLYAIIACKFL